MVDWLGVEGESEQSKPSLLNGFLTSDSTETYYLILFIYILYNLGEIVLGKAIKK